MCQSGVGPSYHPPEPPLPTLTLKDFVLCVQLPVCCARIWLCTLVARLVHGYALRRSSVGPAARLSNVAGLESKPSRSASTVACVLEKLSLELKGAALWALPRLSMCERGGLCRLQRRAAASGTQSHSAHSTDRRASGCGNICHKLCRGYYVFRPAHPSRLSLKASIHRLVQWSISALAAKPADGARVRGPQNFHSGLSEEQVQEHDVQRRRSGGSAGCG